MAAGLTAAKSAGAGYADVRIGRQRQNFVFTREQQIQNVVDTDSMGCGIRALVDGTWGFAATRVLTKDGVAAAAKEAVSIAKANRAARDRPVVLTPAPVERRNVEERLHEGSVGRVGRGEGGAAAQGERRSAEGEGRQVHLQRAVLREGRAQLREHRRLAHAADGGPLVAARCRSPRSTPIRATSRIARTSRRRWGAAGNTCSSAISRATRSSGARRRSQKLTAKPVEVGRYDLVLHPSHLWLTIHESVAHPTELDRAMGYEANYAGTSFVSPPEKMLGQLKYGPELMNIQGDRSQAGCLGTVGWDDEGVKPEPFLIIKKGIVNDYQTTREQAAWLDWWYKKQGRETRSHGCSYAQNWDNVQFQRMPNVSLLPGEKEQSFEDLIAATDRGIAIIGDGSFSIDQQRYNAQFGGQVFHEIKGGKIVGQLKDVAYQMRTPDFWNSMDMIGGKKSYELGGSFFDGKGQPGQINAVSHGAVPARFRNINVINTGRKA